MNNVKTNEKQFRFFIKEIESNVKVLRLKVRANVIKYRSIHLLEWAIIAPLVEMDEPKPTIKEIATQFCIEKVDFLSHTASQLANLGITQQLSNGEFEVTELGKMLYKKGEMLSDPREITFPMFCDTESNEWFIGSNITEESIIGTASIYNELKSSDLFPHDVPEKLINLHARVTNRIDDGERILENRILNVDEIVVPLKANVFLKTNEIETWAIEQPFGDDHRKLVSKILKHSLLQTGKIKAYFEDFSASIEGYAYLQKVQSSSISQSSELFLPNIPSKLIEKVLSSNPNWLITRDIKSFEHLSKKKNKPLITVYIKQKDNPFTIENSENDIVIPKSIEVVVFDTDIDDKVIPESTLISENTLYSLNIVEAEDCEIPLYIVQENSRPEIGKELLMSILEKSNSKFKEKLAKFYLEQTESNFQDVIRNYPLETVTDSKSSKIALNSITELRTNIESIPQDDGQELEIYKKIMEHLFFDDLIEFDANKILQCKNAYFRRLNQLLEKDFAESKNESWENSLQTLKKSAGRYNDLFCLNDRIEKFGIEMNFLEMSIETKKIVERYESCISNQINLLPDTSNLVNIEKLLKTVQLYHNKKIENVCLKKIDSFLSLEKADISSDKLLDMYFYLSRKGVGISEDKLYSVVRSFLESTGFDLLDVELHKKVKKINQKCSEIFPSFNLYNVIATYLPESIEKIDSKNKANILVTNLAELSKITKEIDTEYVLNLLTAQENALLENESFEDLKIWLSLLSNVKKKIENRDGKRILGYSNNEVWDIIYSYVQGDTSIIAVLEKDLNELDLGNKIKDLKNKNTKKISSNLKKESHELEYLDTPHEEVETEKVSITPQFKLLSCPTCNKVSLGYIEIKSSKPVLSCRYCRNKIEIESNKFVFDSNVLVNCLFSDLSDTDFFAEKTIIIPKTVTYELRHWKESFSTRFLHKTILEEIGKIREAHDKGKLKCEIKGEEASNDEMRVKDRPDEIIAKDTIQENALLVTSDRDFEIIDPNLSVLIYKSSPLREKEIVDLTITGYEKYDGVAYYKGYKINISGCREMMGVKVKAKITSVSYDKHLASAYIP
jgi:predicted nucleic acid-binding protein